MTTFRVSSRLDRERSPPANFLKLVEQNNSKVDGGPRAHSSQASKVHVPDPVKDLEERLNKLKERPNQSMSNQFERRDCLRFYRFTQLSLDKPIPNDAELASKLNQIKGKFQSAALKIEPYLKSLTF